MIMKTMFGANDVANWNASKFPEEFVGATRSPYSCPLATYFMSNGYENVAVFEEHYTLDGERYLTPVWMKDILLEVDAMLDVDLITSEQFAYIMDKLGY